MVLDCLGVEIEPLGPAAWAEASQAGAELDRRAFMRLILGAEHDLLNPKGIG